ncbi:MAG: trigger factor, partial [Snodgrassella alvi]|nr:trigger factor [Snodgrassella alvi]
LPDFETGIAGMKEGDVKEVSVTFPEDYQSKELAGKTAIFTITLKNVSEAVLPEVNEEFAKSLGIEDGDVEKMRAEIKKNVSREVNRRVSEMTKDSAINALLASTPIEVPTSMITEEAKSMAARMKENFAAQGMDQKDLDLPLDMFNEQASRRVAISLIMGELIREEKLEPSEEQVRKVINEFADSYEDPQEVIDWYYSDKKNLQVPTSLAIEQNVVDYVLSKAKVSDKVLTFDEVMGQQAQA